MCYLCVLLLSLCLTCADFIIGFSLFCQRLNLLVYFVAKREGDTVFSIALLYLESATTSSSRRAVLKTNVVTELF